MLLQMSCNKDKTPAFCGNGCEILDNTSRLLDKWG
jgi:hypothetical protein